MEDLNSHPETQNGDQPNPAQSLADMPSFENRHDQPESGDHGFHMLIDDDDEAEEPSHVYDSRYVEEMMENEYAKSGRLEEYKLSKQLQKLERQRLELEHKLIIARQDRERRERISKYEEKIQNGENLSFAAKLIFEIDKELENELSKTYDSFDDSDE